MWADERALKQILINLVSNAVKFAPEGGRITVIGSRARCGSFQIMVEDNGPGIPREKLDKIFKPFSQVDNRYDRQGGGTGLGLALVRGLTELHGGRAWIESEQGKGCRAYVLLPTDASGMPAENRVARTDDGGCVRVFRCFFRVDFFQKNLSPVISRPIKGWIFGEITGS